MKGFLQQCFDDVQSAEALSDDKRGRLAGLLGTSCRAKVHPPSITPLRRSLIFLCTNAGGKSGSGSFRPFPGLLTN